MTHCSWLASRQTSGFREARKARMTDGIKVTVGGSLKDDLAAFRGAGEQAERDETVQPERVLAF